MGIKWEQCITMHEKIHSRCSLLRSMILPCRCTQEAHQCRCQGRPPRSGHHRRSSMGDRPDHRPGLGSRGVLLHPGASTGWACPHHPWVTPPAGQCRPPAMACLPRAGSRMGCRRLHRKPHRNSFYSFTDALSCCCKGVWELLFCLLCEVSLRGGV